MSMTLGEYLDLITSEHRKRPIFRAVTAAAVAPLADTVGFVDTSMLQAWDLDTAVGTQLDQVGEWIGTTRYIEKPIVGYYFTWDDMIEDGWEHGYWQGKYDPSTGIVALGDEVFRTVLYAKIASNNWDGTRETMEDIWNGAFGDSSKIMIQDHQDMSITITIVGLAVNAFLEYILRSGRVPLRPEGVRIRDYILTTDLIFGFDSLPGNALVGGFDEGHWGTVINENQ